MVTDLKERFRIGRVIFVADRGVLSDPNLEMPLDQDPGFIVAHPHRHSAIAKEVIREIGKRFDRSVDEEQFADEMRTSHRFVLAFSPQIAAEVKDGRKKRLAEAEAFIRESLDRLAHPAPRRRKPTPQGTYDRIRDHLRARKLLSFYIIEIRKDEVVVAPNKEVRKWEETMDGMLLLETTDMESRASEIVGRYKELAEIERGFRTLKSALKLCPVFHWTPEGTDCTVVWEDRGRKAPTTRYSDKLCGHSCRGRREVRADESHANPRNRNPVIGFAGMPGTW